MVDTIKFSQMTNAGNINNNDVMPTLRSGANVLVNNPWTFLPSGTTAERPTPSTEINYRLRFNTDDSLYEYYDAVSLAWIQLASGSPSALTATPDTNVTITLGGTPATALLAPTSITLGWTGTLSPARGGLGTGSAPTNGQVPAGSGGNYEPTSIGSGTGITVTLGAGSISVGLASVSTLNLLANLTGGSAAPTPHTLSEIIDACIGSAQGDILYRSATTWSVLAPGTSGFFLQTQGAAANPQWSAALSTSLTSAHIFVGNGSNVATDVAMSGDATLANTGALTVASIGGKAVSLGGSFTMSGAFTFTGTLTGNTSVTFPTSGTLATTGGSVATLTGNTGFATASGGNINVTGSTTGLTFTGATDTLTLGGTLGLSNGGTNNSLTASAGGIVWSDATKLNILGGTSTANQILLSGNADTPAWSTTTYPATNAINTIMYASSANVLGVITPVNSAVLVSSAGGVPSWAPQLSLASGGTNANLTAANGAIPYSTATAFALLAPGTSGQLLQSGGAGAPSWTTTTFPSTGGAAGNILISNGTNYIASTSLWPNTVGSTGTILRSNGTSNAYTTSTFADTYAVSTILYASSANTVSGLATANSSVLITSAGGVPSLSTTLPSGIAATNMALTTPTIKGSNGFNVATFADVASATDYFSFTAGIADGAVVQLISGSTDASFKILAKGTGGVTIGSAAATTNPMTWTNSTNTFAVTIPTWTGNRLLTLPDANVTLVSGVMLPNALTSAHIFVGSGLNVATDVAMSGDATLANTGAITVASIGGKAVTLGGAFTMSGAFAFTGTLTNTTTVTFPTSGTLATTAQILAKTNITGASATLTVNTAHTINTTPVFAICNLALPTTAAVGDIIQVKGNYSLGWTITQNSGQTIHGGVGSTTTGVTGGLTAPNRYDCIELTCVVADTDFVISSIDGNIQADVVSGKIFNATNSGNVLTLGGPFTTVGTFSVTQTYTANTSVTFPTSGTLATLAGTETFTNKTITGTVNAQTGTTYTFVAADLRGKVTASNASAQTYTLPQQSTLTTAAGVSILFQNIGAGTVTLVKEGSETLLGRPTVAPGATVQIYRNTTTTWSIDGGVTSVPLITTYTSGSGTFTTNANTRYMRVVMVGGGAGGGGSGTTGQTDGTDGGQSSFGSAMCNGGSKGLVNGSLGGQGGNVTAGSISGIANSGSYGSPGGSTTAATLAVMGGSGGCSALSGNGSGSGGTGLGAGTAGATNSGSGGGGAGCAAIGGSTGAGGGSGGFIDGYITAPAATYSYAVGAAGTGGSAGTSGSAGGNGGSGFIMVTEFF